MKSLTNTLIYRHGWCRKFLNVSIGMNIQACMNNHVGTSFFLHSQHLQVDIQSRSSDVRKTLWTARFLLQYSRCAPGRASEGWCSLTWAFGGHGWVSFVLRTDSSTRNTLYCLLSKLSECSDIFRLFVYLNDILPFYLFIYFCCFLFSYYNSYIHIC